MPEPRSVLIVGGGTMGRGIAGVCALALGLDPRAQNLLRLSPDEARWIAPAVGGLAVLVAVGVSWEWRGALRWIAVGPDGLRWFRGGRLHTRAWDQLAGVQRKATRVIVNGQHVNTVPSVQIQFHEGPPLVVSPLIVPGYEALVSAIEYSVQRCGRTGRCT